MATRAEANKHWSTIPKRKAEKSRRVSEDSEAAEVDMDSFSRDVDNLVVADATKDKQLHDKLLRALLLHVANGLVATQRAAR